MVWGQERQAPGLGRDAFDVLLTIDSKLEYQQNLATLPIGVLVIQAVSKRIEHLEPVVPNILQELKQFLLQSLRRVAC